MSEEKKTTETEEPQEKHQESKRYLIFYVIALFSVALVLILLSYLTQVKADKELANMGVQLQEQTTAVEGAQARMEVLQKTVEEQSSMLEELQAQLDEQKARTDEYREKYKALATLLEAQELEKQGKLKEAKEMAASLDARYGADRLDGMGEDDLLTPEQAAICWSLNVLDVPEEPAVENPQ